MFQCIGLAGESEGGCGEDWWHPECVMGLRKNQPQAKQPEPLLKSTPESVANGSESIPSQQEEDQDEELPPGFPAEDDFETFVCYKCVEANPWIKRYASSTGFLPPVFKHNDRASDGLPKLNDNVLATEATAHQQTTNEAPNSDANHRDAASDKVTNPPTNPLKRRADDDEESLDPQQPKKTRMGPSQNCYYASLPVPETKLLSLFLKEDFRDHFCRCIDCYPNLRQYPQLLEEENSYEQPLSSEDENVRGSVGTGSLLDRGEAALNNVDRVRAIGTPPFTSFYHLISIQSLTSSQRA